MESEAIVGALISLQAVTMALEYMSISVKRLYLLAVLIMSLTKAGLSKSIHFYSCPILLGLCNRTMDASSVIFCIMVRV